MKTNYLVRIASLSIFASVTLIAQVARRADVPLKNWATPFYWHPNQVEKETTVRSEPQFQFSANAVSTDALTFIAITPCRLVDTRGVGANFNGISPFSGPSIAAAGTATFPVQSAAEASANTAPAPCGVIPSIAQGYSLNLTVVPKAGGAVNYVSLWPAGGTQPFVSTLDDPQGAILSNAAIVPAGTPTGGISVYNAGPAATDVIIDMNGYFAAPTDLSGNTAIGSGTLAGNTFGFENTAAGSGALQNNTTGNNNTASGADALFSNTTGCCNTASGVVALASNTTGNYNTAVGEQALQLNTIGTGNTASGFDALAGNTTGSSNTASGVNALRSNTTGSNSTASGANALQGNTTGVGNTAFGAYALQNNTTGETNTATGNGALSFNTTGLANTASGNGALSFNITGSANTAIGVVALQSNTTGSFNTASGGDALTANTSGADNTASGDQALYHNTTGGNNVAVGYQAAYNVNGANSNNIHVGSQGASGDSAAIRIGTQGTQTSTYIAAVLSKLAAKLSGRSRGHWAVRG